MIGLDSNAGEMAAAVGSLVCHLGTVRGALLKAEANALEGFTGPERDRFVERCQAIHRQVRELEALLAGLPARIEVVGDEIVHVRRNALADKIGPGAEVVNGIANRLGW